MHNLIHDFVVLAQHHFNFTKTASVLHLSQPGLTKHIQMLERELGVSLIIRDPKSPRLTPLGRVFLAGAKELDQQYSDLTERVRALKRQSPSKLTYAAEMTYRPVSDVIRAALIDLADRYPLLETEYWQNLQESRFDALQEGKVDVAAFAYSETLGIEAKGFASLPVICDPLVAIVPRSDRLAEAGSISPQDLVGRQIQLPGEPYYSEYSLCVQELIQSRGVDVEYRLRGWYDGQGYYVFDWTDRICITVYGVVHQIPMPLLSKYAIVPFSDPGFFAEWRLVYRADSDDEVLLAFIQSVRNALEAGRAITVDEVREEAGARILRPRAL